jgi:hypothetical protein
MTPIRLHFYRQRLETLAIEKNHLKLLPELYYVPDSAIEAERQVPYSQPRLPNDNIPLVWAQSLYYLGKMIQDGLLTLGDLDPLARHLRVGQHRQPIVQIALLAEDETLQQQLANYGIQTQVLEQLDPVQVYPAVELSALYAQIGGNEKFTPHWSPGATTAQFDDLAHLQASGRNGGIFACFSGPSTILSDPGLSFFWLRRSAVSWPISTNIGMNQDDPRLPCF